MFTESEREFAQNIRYYSPRIYRILRIKFPNLPSPQSIKRWQKFQYIQTGHNNELKTALQEKVKYMEELEKNCILIFDELSIHPRLEYNAKLDRIIGT